MVAEVRAAATLQRRHRASKRREESGALVGGQRADGGAWVDPRAKEHLVAQEIPDAGDARLVEETRFDRGALTSIDAQ